jgi:hypothetical protein
MIAEALLSVVLASGPSLPAPIQIGPKQHNGQSLYRGKHFKKAHESVRKCIRHRESKGDYRAVSASGRYRGAYQVSPAMAVGMGWNVQRELSALVGKVRARSIGEALRAHPANQWGMYWQDMAFWITWNDGKGKHHWQATVPGTGCF